MRKMRKMRKMLVAVVLMFCLGVTSFGAVTAQAAIKTPTSSSSTTSTSSTKTSTMSTYYKNKTTTTTTNTKTTTTTKAYTWQKDTTKKVVLTTTVTTKYQYKKTVKTTVKTTTTKSSIYYYDTATPTINSLSGKIPAGIITKFKSEGFVIVNNAGDSVLGSSTSCGLFSPSKKTIYLRKNVPHVLAHEVGHYTDRALGYSSNSSEWNSIFNTEASKYVAKYGYKSAGTSKAEFFAEVFSAYAMKDSAIKTTCPKAYAYVVKVSATVK